ncbi:MAG: PEP-CTERM sorting domain-containing protein, partial [Pirellulales bacterium]
GSVNTDFQTAGNWTLPTPYNPVPFPGQEVAPPRDSSFVIVNGDYTVVLNDERSGLNDTFPLGAFRLGSNTPNGTTTQVQMLVLNNSATFTGLERTNNGVPAGQYNTQLRHLRVGVGRNSSDGEGFSDVFAWGIVKQTAGLVDLTMDEVKVAADQVPPYEQEVPAQTNRAEILLSSDKDKAGASLWEIGGTASLMVPDEIRLGDRASVVQGIGHSIFRVRGSNVGSVKVGPAASAGTAPGRFKVVSRAGLWAVDTPVEYNSRPRYNTLKSIVEFVLDAGGVTPIEAFDQVVIGGDDPYPTGHPLAGVQTALPPGFLRVKLSEPTTKGTGAYDAMNPDNNLVLFRSDRITVDTTGGFVATGTEFDEGRFFDPDRDGPSLGVGLTPHRRMWENDDVIADYAGQTYTWKIHYFESGTGGLPDTIISDSVYLDNLNVTGVLGDLDKSGVANATDRGLLAAAVGSPPTLLALLGGPQNVYDLNADDAINSLDLALYDSFFDVGLAGDFNNNHVVDAADYTLWRNNLGATEGTLLNGNGNGGTIDATDYDLWKLHFGESSGPGSGSLGAGAVPEPGTLLMCMLSVFGFVGFRRRAA